MWKKTLEKKEMFYTFRTIINSLQSFFFYFFFLFFWTIGSVISSRTKGQLFCWLTLNTSCPVSQEVKLHLLFFSKVRVDKMLDKVLDTSLALISDIISFSKILRKMFQQVVQFFIAVVVPGENLFQKQWIIAACK